MSIPDRIMQKIHVDTNGCWIWQGYIDIYGYGKTLWKGRKQGVYRATWEATRGPIPDGLQVDHLCRVRACCNPAHLDLVTSPENTRRGQRSRYAENTHCKNGHEFTPENTMLITGKYRRCRTCDRAYCAAKYQNRKQRLEVTRL